MQNEIVSALTPSRILENRGVQLTPHQREVVDSITSCHGRESDSIGTGSLSAKQEEALRRFAVANGRTWKCRLIASWMKGTDDRLSDGGLLRQIRNELGSQWLRNYRLVER